MHKEQKPTLEEKSRQKKALNIRIVDLVEVKELNSTWRKRDYATNVLTFEYGVDPNYLPAKLTDWMVQT